MISFAVDFSQRLKRMANTPSFSPKNTMAKAIGFDDHYARQLKQTAKDNLGIWTDIHKKR